MKIALCLVLLVTPLMADELSVPAGEMKSAVLALLDTLDGDQKKLVSLDMASETRGDFRYTPRDRSGLLYKGLDEKQRAAVIRLLQTAMSEVGLMKAQEIMALEGVLAEMEKRPQFRDPEKYFISIFGAPGDAKGWGWKFEGHHLSLNYTMAGKGRMAVTPSFFGANPAEVRQGERKGLRVLAAEEDLARALLKQLREAGNKDVVFSDKAPEEILTREQSKVEPLAAVGVLAADMTPTQQKALMKLIGEFLNRHRAELAQADMAKINAAGVDKIRFGWAGSIEPGGAWYYRIQGPTFLIEGANTQNQANHIHVTWRDFDGDFGRDLLGEHYHEHTHADSD